jgi:hypothetical protein
LSLNVKQSQKGSSINRTLWGHKSALQLSFFSEARKKVLFFDSSNGGEAVLLLQTFADQQKPL